MDAPRILSEILIKLSSHVRPGISTFTLDSLAEAEITKRGVFSFNKGYKPKWSKYPYPAVSCISVNDTIAHGIPSEKVILQAGDLVNIDIGIMDQAGNCADANFSLSVGEISEKDKLLLRYAKKTLYAGIEKVKDGVTIYEIAKAMEAKAAERKFVINHQLCGHGIGRKMHLQPSIYQVTNPFAHYSDSKQYDEYEKYMQIRLKAGQMICLEPYVTYFDKWGEVQKENGWSFQTRDKQKGAAFEHQILVTKTGCEILTTHFTKDM